MRRLIDLVVWIFTLGRRGRAPWRQAAATEPAPESAAARTNGSGTRTSGAFAGGEGTVPSAAATDEDASATDGEDLVATGGPLARAVVDVQGTEPDPPHAASTDWEPALIAAADDPDGEDPAVPSDIFATGTVDATATGAALAQAAVDAESPESDAARAVSNGEEPAPGAAADNPDGDDAAVPPASSATDMGDSVAADEPLAQEADSDPHRAAHPDSRPAPVAAADDPGREDAAASDRTTGDAVAAGEPLASRAEPSSNADPERTLRDMASAQPGPQAAAAACVAAAGAGAAGSMAREAQWARDGDDSRAAEGGDGAGPHAAPRVRPAAEMSERAAEARPGRRGFRVETTTPPYEPEARERPAFARGAEFRATVHEVPDPGYALYLLPRAVDDIQFHLEWGTRTRGNLVEQGGILLGQAFRDPRDGVTWGLVERAVAGVSAQGSPAFVQFDHRTWREMLEQVDGLPAGENGPPQVIGWYHTHPGELSVFFSGTDRATQRRMFYADWHFAMVLNPQRRYWRVFHGADCAECDGGVVRYILPGSALAAPATDAEGAR